MLKSLLRLEDKVLATTSIQTKENIISLIRANQKQIRSFGVKRLGLFGSVVRGQQKANSDVDVLVEFDPKQKTFDNFVNLSSFLENLFSRYVEVVTPESLSPYIGPHIIKEVEYVAFDA